MILKKLIVIAGVLMLLYIAAGTLAAPQAKESTATPQAQQSAAEDAYCIGVDGDCVAIFHNGALVYKSDTRLNELPKADQKRLQEGIPAASLSEIKAMIEDYCS